MTSVLKDDMAEEREGMLPLLKNIQERSIEPNMHVHEIFV